jgi:hypothetical protein
LQPNLYICIVQKYKYGRTPTQEEEKRTVTKVEQAESTADFQERMEDVTG